MKTSMKVLLLSTMMTLVALLVFSRLDLRLEQSAKGSKLSQTDTVVQREIPVKKVATPAPKPPVPQVPINATPAPKPPVPQVPIKGTYPKWFSSAWDRSSTAKYENKFVSDEALFPACKKKRSNSDDMYTFIEPKRYVSNSINPCWYDISEAKKRGFRCIPHFYIAGVAKCGTTDLYRRLRMHPNIMQGTKKEYHFWDRERFGNMETTDTGEIVSVLRKPWTFKEYTDLITGDELNVVKEEVMSDQGSIKLFGDGSPSYLWDIHKWLNLEGNEGCNEPRIVIGQHIRHIYPPSKMILIFRHPTPRLYSRFLSRIWRTNYLKNANSETFHNYVVKGVKMYRQCFDKWSVRACAYNYTLFDDAVVRLVEGMYPVFMADWLRIWPKEQMLILRSEDYGQNLTATLEKAFDFLGVDKVTGEDYGNVMNQKLVNVGGEYEKIGPMKPDTVKILDEFYQPFVDKFAEILQDPRFLWKDTYTPSHV